MRAEVARAARRLEVEPRALELFLDVRGALHRGLLGLPDLLEVGVLPLQLARAARRAPARRFFEASSFSFFSASRSILQLDDAPVEPVHLLGLGVDLHADARRGLVDQVDGLVGQLAVGDVAMRERRRGDDRRDR